MAYVQKNNPFNSSGSPLKQDGGKWGQRDPGTGWSQKEKLKDPAGHSKAVSEGVKEGLPLVLGATPMGRGIKVLGKALSSIAPKAVSKMAGAFANTAKQYLGKSKGKPKFPKMSAEKKKFFNPDGSSKTGDLYAAARARANKPATRPTGGFKELVTGNQTHTTKSINKAFEQRFGKPKTSKPKAKKAKPSKPSKPNTVEGSNIKYNIERPSAKSQGMSTPLTPKLKPKNPRGYETITLKGGRKMTKPGTPGSSTNIGGKQTYSAKDPLWPKPIDKQLYPKNWM